MSPLINIRDLVIHGEKATVSIVEYSNLFLYFFHSFVNSIGNQYSPLLILGLVDTLPTIFHSDENLLTLHLVSLGGAIVTFMVLVMHTISYMIYLSVICWYIIIVFLIVEHEILPIEFQMALPTKFRHSRWFKPDILLRSTISSGA